MTSLAAQPHTHLQLRHADVLGQPVTVEHALQLAWHDPHQQPSFIHSAERICLCDAGADGRGKSWGNRQCMGRLLCAGRHQAHALGQEVALQPAWVGAWQRDFNLWQCATRNCSQGDMIIIIRKGPLQTLLHLRIDPYWLHALLGRRGLPHLTHTHTPRIIILMG